MQIPEKFNIRVYGLLIKNNHVLCCRENHKGKEYFKFPGGGLEFGEGILDCLLREFLEETNLQLHQSDFFYMNEFYQQSAFNSMDQLISIYYLVDTQDELSRTQITEIRNGLPWEINLEWHDLQEFDINKLTFPIDKLVMNKLKSQ
jgi:8-oxo-dGTP diphosphatase